MFRRSVFFTLAAALGTCGLIGALHLPAARPLLSWVASSVGCPVSLDGGDAATLEAHRVVVARSRAGVDSAKGRPALAFELGTTSRPTVQAWLSARNADCEDWSSGAVLRCRIEGARDVALDAHLQFDESDRLVAVDLWHAPRPAGESIAALSTLTDSVTRTVGAPTLASGPLDGQYLQARPFRRVARDYRYADYVARLSATNLGRRGFRLREQYQWVPPST
jgi:hypothetical protein